VSVFIYTATIKGLYMNVDTAVRISGSLIELAEAALSDDTKLVRVRAHELDRAASERMLADLPRPATSDARVLCVCAAVVELLAERFGCDAPSWTQSVGALSQPFVLIPSMRAYPDSIKAMVNDTPEPLRKRNLIATRNFLA
jgi:hypothetical protein